MLNMYTLSRKDMEKSKNILGGKGVGLAEMAHLKNSYSAGFYNYNGSLHGLL